MQKRITWLRRFAPHKQEDHEELSIHTEKSKYGMDRQQKGF